MTAKTPFLAKVCCGLSIAVLALAFTSGVSAVRAETEALSWREMFVDPIFSGGVYIALRTGQLAAEAIAKAFRTGRFSARHFARCGNPDPEPSITSTTIEAGKGSI